MGIAERKQRQKEEVRSQILHAAWKLVQQEGWQALSLRKIAEAIEYSVPVIYDHFLNKEAILQEFTRQGFQRLYDELSKVKKRYADPEKQIEQIAFSYWDFAFENKEYYQLMYGLGMPTCETVRQIPELGAFTDLLQDSVNQLIKKTGRTDLDPFTKMKTFWSMLHGLISINMMSEAVHREETDNLILSDFIHSFIAGLKT